MTNAEMLLQISETSRALKETEARLENLYNRTLTFSKDVEDLRKNIAQLKEKM